MTAEVKSRGRLGRVVGLAVAVVSVTVGLGLVLLAVTVGDCAAFGGRCPATPPPLWEDDVFGLAAVGGALATGVPYLALRPSRRRLVTAIGLAIGAAVVVGWFARVSANG